MLYEAFTYVGRLPHEITGLPFKERQIVLAFLEVHREDRLKKKVPDCPMFGKQ